MTEEELTRFALVLKECERIRAMIAQEGEAAAGADGGGELDNPSPMVRTPIGICLRHISSLY